MLDADVSRLIERIYAGMHCACAWDAALDGLIARTDSRFVMVSAVDLARREYSVSRFYGADDGRFLDGVADYRSELYRDDPTLTFAMRHPDAESVSLRRRIADPHSCRAERDYAAWVESQLGASESVVFYTPPIDRLTVGVSLHTPTGATAYSRDQRRIFRLLFDHIHNAMRLAARPVVLDGPEASLLVDRRGVVRHASDAARTLIARGDALRWADGALRTIDRAAQPRLDALLRSALGAAVDGGAGGSMSIGRSGEDGADRRPLLLTLRPLPPDASPAHIFGPVALVRLVDPDDRTPGDACWGGARWAGALGLTPAETRLATMLLDHQDGLCGAAGRLGITHAIARVQLASIFDKAGVRTQGQLIRLLGRLGA